MKKIATLVILLTVVATSFAQFRDGERTTFTSIKPVFADTVHVRANDIDTLYVLFPTDRWDASTSVLSWNTAPTVNTPQFQNTNGDILLNGDAFMAMRYDTLDAEESDSLLVYAKPLMYRKRGDSSDGYVISTNDSTFFDMDLQTPNAKRVPVYSDLTTGKTYTAILSGELWCTVGFVIFVQHVANDDATSACSLEFDFWFSR